MLPQIEDLLTTCSGHCERSCTKCLRHYGNRFLHPRLDRRLGLQLLRYARFSEKPPIPSVQRTEEDSRTVGEIFPVRRVDSRWKMRRCSPPAMAEANLLRSAPIPHFFPRQRQKNVTPNARLRRDSHSAARLPRRAGPAIRLSGGDEACQSLGLANILSSRSKPLLRRHGILATRAQLQLFPNSSIIPSRPRQTQCPCACPRMPTASASL